MIFSRVMKVCVLGCALGVLGSVEVLAREQIRAVGSSTVYPFSTVVSERFSEKTGHKGPIVESTGTGGGFKLFCQGVGEETPDIANASRRMKASELELCAKNGVTDVVELQIGYDGLSLAMSKEASNLALTKKQIFLALARHIPDQNGILIPNPHKTWADVDPSLPATEIEVLGPPPTSGTRDSFVELVMEAGAEEIPSLAALKAQDPKAFEVVWKSLREDGAYVDSGENDNLIVQKLSTNPEAVGIFGFSYLEANKNVIKDISIDGVFASYDAIADGSYSVARPLYVYLKKQHVGVVPGLQEFFAEFASEDVVGEEGYLTEKGLVALPTARLEAAREAVKTLPPLKPEDL